MKVLVLYSSRTGNTKKIAETIYEEIGKGDCFSVEDYPKNNFNEYDLIFLGSWINRGDFSKELKKAIENIKNKKIAYFATMGAYPNSEHAKKITANIEEFLVKNIVLGGFFSLGAVDPEHLKKYNTKEYSSSKHPMTPERIKRLQEAKSHPDENDVENAKKFYREIIFLYKKSLVKI